MDQSRHSTFDKTQPEAKRKENFISEAVRHAPISQANLIPAQNGPGWAVPQVHPLLQTIALPAAPGLDSSNPFLATRQGSTFWDNQQQITAQERNQFQQMFLLQQLQMQQLAPQALLAAEMALSGVALHPSQASDYQSSISESGLAARAQLAMAHAQLAAQSMLQPVSLRSVSSSAARDGTLNPLSSTLGKAKNETKQQQIPRYYSGTAQPPDPLADDEHREELYQDLAENGSSSVAKERFPCKLYRMLDEAKKNGDDNIVAFFAHGRAFAIHKPRDFLAKIMPRYFTTSRLPSFQRQLNLYGFRRINEGRDKGGYYHENFLQGRKDLCRKILRKKVKPRPPKPTEAENPSGALAHPFAAASFGLVDHVVHAQMDQKQPLNRQHLATPTHQFGNRGVINELVGFRGSTLQGMGALGAVAETSRFATAMTAQPSQFDSLSRRLKAHQGLRQDCRTNFTTDGEDDGDPDDSD